MKTLSPHRHIPRYCGLQCGHANSGGHSRPTTSRFHRLTLPPWVRYKRDCGGWGTQLCFPPFTPLGFLEPWDGQSPSGAPLTEVGRAREPPSCALPAPLAPAISHMVSLHTQGPARLVSLSLGDQEVKNHSIQVAILDLL